MTFYPGMKEELNLSTILHSFDSHLITYPIDITHEQIIHCGINHDHVIHLPVYDYDRKNLCFHPYHGADVSMVPISRNDLQSFLTLLHPDIASIFRKWFNDAYPNEPRTRSIGSCYMA